MKGQKGEPGLNGSRGAVGFPGEKVPEGMIWSAHRQSSTAGYSLFMKNQRGNEARLVETCFD